MRLKTLRWGIPPRSRVAVAVLASTLLATGCASSGGSETSEGGPSEMSQEELYTAGIVGDQADAGDPVEGGTLTIAEYAEARSLDPTVTIPNGATGGNALAAIYDTLMRYDQQNDEWVPQLAESLESNEDHTQWTLTLREGVQFSDGTPLDAAAVAQSIGYYMENAGFYTLLLASNISDIKPTDERTVVFTLRQPWTTFPKMLATGAGMIMAPAAIKGGPDNFKPIGAGPFLLDEYKPSEELTLTANEDYWGGAPHLDGLRFVWLGSDEAKMDAMDSGSIDIANVRSATSVEAARKDGYAGIMNPVGTASMLWINNREGSPGADPRVRRAINLAIDPEVYLERSAGGAGIPSRSLYSESLPYHEDIETIEHDPEEAKQLVEEAKADGADTSLGYIGQSDPISQNAAVAMEAQLEAVGFDVELELLNDVTEQTKRMYVTHDFDLSVGSMSLAEAPFAGLYTNLQSKSPQNPSGYGSEEMDQLLTQLQGAEESGDLLTQINQLWQEDLPGVILSAGAFFQPWQETVHGVAPSADTLMLFHDAWKTEG